MSKTKEQVLQELDVRLKRIEKQTLEAELCLEVAILEDNIERIEELLVDIENLVRKLNWFRNSIKRARGILDD